jgi:hypothetical protein
MWSLFLLVVVHNVLASGMSTADHIVAAFGAQNCLSSVQCCSSVGACMDGWFCVSGPEHVVTGEIKIDCDRKRGMKNRMFVTL